MRETVNQRIFRMLVRNIRIKKTALFNKWKCRSNYWRYKKYKIESSILGSLLRFKVRNAFKTIVEASYRAKLLNRDVHICSYL